MESRPHRRTSTRRGTEILLSHETLAGSCLGHGEGTFCLSCAALCYGAHICNRSSNRHLTIAGAGREVPVVARRERAARFCARVARDARARGRSASPLACATL